MGEFEQDRIEQARVNSPGVVDLGSAAAGDTQGDERLAKANEQFDAARRAVEFRLKFIPIGLVDSGGKVLAIVKWRNYQPNSSVV